MISLLISIHSFQQPVFHLYAIQRKWNTLNRMVQSKLEHASGNEAFNVQLVWPMESVSYFVWNGKAMTGLCLRWLVLDVSPFVHLLVFASGVWGGMGVIVVKSYNMHYIFLQDCTLRKKIYTYNTILYTWPITLIFVNTIYNWSLWQQNGKVTWRNIWSNFPIRDQDMISNYYGIMDVGLFIKVFYQRYHVDRCSGVFRIWRKNKWV